VLRSEQNPSHRLTFLGLEGPSPERREDAVGPVVGGDVEPTEHLRRGDRLRVHAHLLVRMPAVGHRLHQHVDDARLAGARRAEHHHAVTHSLSLVQLHRRTHTHTHTHTSHGSLMLHTQMDDAAKRGASGVQQKNSGVGFG